MSTEVSTGRQLDVASNMGLVHSVVKRYRWALNASLEQADLEQAGAMGLHRALTTFEPERGFAFSTYAFWWIRHCIMREIQNNGRTVRVPVHAQEKARKLGAPITRDALSLDTPVRPGDPDSATLLDQLASEDDPTAGVDEEQRRETIANALAQLPERTRAILLARFWRDQTLEHVGAALGLTRERIRQVQADALIALRGQLKGGL